MTKINDRKIKYLVWTSMIALMLLIPPVAIGKEDVKKSIVDSSSYNGTCKQATTNWWVCYATSSPTGNDDGLQITFAKFKNVQVIHLASVPWIRVLHPPAGGNACYIDQMGTITAGPTEETFTGGWRVKATYTVAPYDYDIRYTFYDDGRFLPEVMIHAVNYGDPNDIPKYTIPFRLDLDIVDAGNDKPATYIGSWSFPTNEGNFPDDGSRSPEGWKWKDLDGGFFNTVGVTPRSTDNLKQMWFAVWHSGEEADDEITSCTVPNYPYERHTSGTNNETVQNKDIVLWHVVERTTTSQVFTGATFKAAW